MLKLHKIQSERIKDFPMGDPNEREYGLLLPPGYDESRAEPYPVVFVMAGWGSKSIKYMNDDAAFGISLRQAVPLAIDSEQIEPCILVFPDGTSKLGCSQYINSPSIGNYMDYICDEIVADVDHHYHTHKSSAFRGVMGHSSGGFGALMIAMKRPEVFQHICSAAGDGFFELSVMKGLTSTFIEIQKAGSIEKFLKDFFDHPNPTAQGFSKFEAMLTLSLAPCYAPEPSKPPLFGEIFFDLETGEIDRTTWERYQTWDPIHASKNHISELKNARYILLDCGLQDEYAAQLNHRQLAKFFEKYSIKHEVEEYPGRHSGNNWRYVNRLQKLLKAMRQN